MEMSGEGIEGTRGWVMMSLFYGARCSLPPWVTFGHFTAKSSASRACAPASHQLLGPLAYGPLALPARTTESPSPRLRRKRRQIRLNEVALKTNRANCRRS